MEVWGGATFDVAMRFLNENPWDRLEQIRKAMPNVLLQMLIRGANAVGYTAYPDNLVEKFIEVSAEKGIDVLKVLKAACVNPLLHYNMEAGLLRVGDAADFILVEDLINFKVIQTYIDGLLVAEKGKSLIHADKSEVINQFNCDELTAAAFSYKHSGEKHIFVIEALEGQLITNKLTVKPKITNNE